MSNHRITYLGEGVRMQARCECKKKSPIGSRDDIEAWVYSHHHEIQRIRTHLGTRNPTIKSQLKWYIEQADNEENSPEDRELWRQLADELQRYLDRQAPIPQEETLF